MFNIYNILTICAYLIIALAYLSETIYLGHMILPEKFKKTLETYKYEIIFIGYVTLILIHIFEEFHFKK
jgi:hypothetical protein